MMRNSLMLGIILFFFIPRVGAEAVLQAKLDSHEVVVEHLTDKHIDINLYKNGLVYTLQKPIEVAAGKNGYRDDYRIKSYNGVTVSFAGKKLGYFPADEMNTMICMDGPPTIKRGCKKLQEGEIILRIPYFPNGKYVDFYNPQGEKIFTLDISSVAVCNENDICEKQNENDINCPYDCAWFKTF